MKIAKIKKSGSKYKIFFDNNEVINTYDEVIINNNILYKKDLDDDLINKINKETNFYDVYNKVLKYINTKLRSEYEINKYLDKFDISSNDKDLIIKMLKERKLIDDCLFTKAFIHDKLSFSNDGPYKIRKDLENYRIDKDIIDREVSSVDSSVFLEKLSKQVILKMKKNTKYSSSMLKQKLLIYFVNLGYDRSDILSVIEGNSVSDSSIIKKEYDKLYHKYSGKYDDEKLKYVIKNKLYQKGFKLDEISEVI